MEAAWVAAWAAVSTAVIYIVLGIFAFRQVSEAKALRMEQSRPYVIVDFSFRQFLIYLEVKNIGKTPARNVVIRFDQPLQTTLSRPRELDESPLLTKPIAMLAPERSIRVLFDVAHERLSREDMPLSYGVTSTYEDQHGRKYRDPEATLDLSPYVGSALDPKSLPDLVDEVEKIRKELAKWTDGSRGVLVQGTDRDKRVRRQDRWHWRQKAASVRKTEGWVSWIRWLVERQLRRYGWTR